MSAYEDIWYRSDDGLKLHARDFPHPQPRATILCMPGLTRNAADFDFIGAHLAADYRLLVAEQRGRGLSQWDSNPANYNPGVYIRDMFALLDSRQLSRVILLGTSLGGLMAMLIAAVQPQRIAALILNDIGPEINMSGMQRIAAYVGRQTAVGNWDEAIAQTRALNAREFPDLDDDGWQKLTRALYRENAQGRPELAYDPAIAPPRTSTGELPELPTLWPQFEAIAAIPLLLIRGAHSDILAASCVERMRAIKPDMQYCELPNRGHAPLLDEPDAVRAIDVFLADIS